MSSASAVLFTAPPIVMASSALRTRGRRKVSSVRTGFPDRMARGAFMAVMIRFPPRRASARASVGRQRPHGRDLPRKDRWIRGRQVADAVLADVGGRPAAERRLTLDQRHEP